MRVGADRLVIHGAREHNLKNVTLDLPRDKLIVFTGLSGSGKSSLAFDTIYAEGQRRYVESLSSYARQFLGQMEKPDVDFIEGLSPAISIDQKSTSRNPRSTVGTITEIYDYLRVLYARVGQPHCPKCGRPVGRQTPDQIVDQVMELAEGTRFQVLAPDRARPQGRVRAPAGRPGQEGVRPRARRRRGPRPDREHPPRPLLQARHRGRRGPAGGQARHPAAGGRLGRDGAPAGRGHGVAGRPDRRGKEEVVTFSQKLACPVRRHLVRRAGAPELLVQLAVRRVPDVRRPGHPAGGRPRADRAGPDAVARRGRGQRVGRPGRRLLGGAAEGGGRRRRVLGRHAVGEAAEGGPRDDPLRHRRVREGQLPEPVRAAALLHHDVRGRHHEHRAPPRRGRVRHGPRPPRAVHARGGVPRVQGRPAQARVAGGDDRRVQHLGADQQVDRRRSQVP